MWFPTKLKVWQVFLLLPVLLWIAWSSYVDFTELEEEGGVLYVGRTTEMLYTLGGKWAVVGFPLVAIGIWGWAVWKTLQLSKRADALAAQAEAPIEIKAPERASKPPAPASKPPAPRAPSGPLKPLAAAPPAPVKPDDRPPDPSGPRYFADGWTRARRKRSHTTGMSWSNAMPSAACSRRK